MVAELRVVDPEDPEGYDWAHDPFQAEPKVTNGGSERTFDLDAEGCVLSNCLNDSSCVDEVRALVQPEYFCSEAHRQIFEAMLELVDEGDAFEIVALASKLRTKDRLAQVGGMAYLTTVLDASPSLLPRFLRMHANTVRTLWVRRKLVELASVLAARCESETVDNEQIMGDARLRIDELAAVSSASEDSCHVGALVQQAIADAAAAARSQGVGARPSGFDRLDRLVAGLHVELTLIGARPGMGKTSLATAIGVHVARRGEGVFIASLETVRGELMTRIICAEGRVDVHRVRTGAATPTDWSRMSEAARVVSEIPLWIDDTSGMTVAELWSKARRTGLQLAREGKRLGLVIVDYVQLLKAPRAGMKREETVAENARALKAMAQDLSVTVLGLAQLNREADKRPDHRPQLSDLRESGELEQCARTVLLLHREDYYGHKKPGYRDNGIVEVHVAKQNNGPTGLAKIGFEAACTRFTNLPEGA